MKIGFYSPYLDTLGGGERYVLTLASHWAKGHDVFVFWDKKDILAKAQRRLDTDLSRVKVAQNIFRRINVFKKLYVSRQYDILFFLSDGSIPSTLARYNILHFQVPFPTIAYSAAKLSRYQLVVCNSQFTKESIDPRVGRNAIVIYPPVRPMTKRAKKEKLILSVGRFSEFHAAKKQNVLIDAFARAAKQKKLTGWRLALAGGLLPSDEGYFHELQNLCDGLPVEIVANASHSMLANYYARASIYWHAAGYGERDPRWMEHFGITTVEAMSAGAVPVVFAGGGQQEVVQDGTNGYLWHTVDELIERTTEMVRDTSKREAMGMQAQKRALDFGESKFTQAFDDLLMNITGPGHVL